MATEIKPIFRFEEEGHRYFLGDQELPSVTTVITAVLGGTITVSPEAWKMAGERGTAVHKACELDDLGTLDESTVGEEWPYLDAYRKFKSEHACEWDGIERRHYHEVYNYAGTIDRMGTLDGRRSILDIKTGLRSPLHDIQLAAYSMLAGFSPANWNRIILHLHSNGDYAIYTSKKSSLAQDMNIFLSALAIYNWQRRNYGG